VRNPKILVLDRSPELADQVASVAAELRPRPQVMPWERIGAVADVLTEDGPFDVLVAGQGLATRTGLARLQVIHDEMPTMSSVLAFTDRPDAQLRDIVRSGAIDLLHLPVTDRVLRECLERAIELSRPATVAPEPLAGAGPAMPAATGTVFTASSATGGCGKTFLATNLAYYLHHHTGAKTCIIDLDLQFGEVSTAMRLRPRFSIADLLAREDPEAPEVDLSGHIEEYMATHETGVMVLPAPRDPSDADRIHPTDVTRVLEAARRRFQYVVVDTPSQLSEVVLAAFDQSDSLYVMATMDLPSVRNMGVFLNTLEKLKIPSDNVRLMLNKAEQDVGIDVDQITKLFPQGFTAVLPYDREVSRSVNVGSPILAFNPGTEVSRRLSVGLSPLLPEEQRLRLASMPGTAPERKPGLLARLFNFNPKR